MGAVFTLIQKIKKGIKQKCHVEISDTDSGISGRGIRILVRAKNYKTKEFMYTEKIITEKEVRAPPNHLHTHPHDNPVDELIKEANYYFRKEQENYCPGEEQSKIYKCEMCKKKLSNEEIKEDITICEKCEISFYGHRTINLI